MEKEFLFEDEFRKWYKNKRVTTKHEVSECVTRIKNVLKGIDGIPYFEKEFLTYVPALMVNNKNMAIQLLSYVYADGYMAGNRCSHLQHYFNFCIRKKIWDGVMPLDDIVYEEIESFLDKRIVWICNPNFKDNYYVNTKQFTNNLSKKFISRIDSWGRNYFPLGKIKRLVNDRTFIDEWKGRTLKTIKVLTEFKKKGSEYSLWDVAFFDFRKMEDNRYSVYVITKKKEKTKVLTPCVETSPREMRVKEPGEMSIDHKTSLSTIIKDIKKKEPEIKELLELLISNKDTEQSFLEVNDKQSGNLKKLLKLVLKKTDCVLMEQGENSRKSNKI